MFLLFHVFVVTTFCSISVACEWPECKRLYIYELVKRVNKVPVFETLHRVVFVWMAAGSGRIVLAFSYAPARYHRLTI